MAKWQNDDMLDAALDYITDNVAQIVLCADQPSTRTAALTDYDGGGTNVGLGEAALTSSSFSAIADDTSGRKLTVPEVSGVTVDVTGSVTHIALISASELLYVTTCVSQSVTSGSTVTIPEWDINILDAS